MANKDDLYFFIDPQTGQYLNTLTLEFRLTSFVGDWSCIAPTTLDKNYRDFDSGKNFVFLLNKALDSSNIYYKDYDKLRPLLRELNRSIEEIAESKFSFFALVPSSHSSQLNPPLTLAYEQSKGMLDTQAAHYYSKVQIFYYHLKCMYDQFDKIKIILKNNKIDDNTPLLFNEKGQSLCLSHIDSAFKIHNNDEHYAGQSVIGSNDDILKDLTIQNVISTFKNLSNSIFQHPDIISSELVSKITKKEVLAKKEIIMAKNIIDCISKKENFAQLPSALENVYLIEFIPREICSTLGPIEKALRFRICPIDENYADFISGACAKSENIFLAMKKLQPLGLIMPPNEKIGQYNLSLNTLDNVFSIIENHHLNKNINSGGSTESTPGVKSLINKI